MKMETRLDPPSEGVQVWAAHKPKSVERAPRLFDAKRAGLADQDRPGLERAVEQGGLQYALPIR
jgi:hypothetical protein